VTDTESRLTIKFFKVYANGLKLLKATRISSLRQSIVKEGNQNKKQNKKQTERREKNKSNEK
jgi:hypothetical protein